MGNVYRIPTRSFFGVSKPQSYEISKILHGSPKQVYDIVSQVDQYKTFVPLLKTRSYHRGTKTSYLREQGCLWVGKTLLKNLSVI